MQNAPQLRPGEADDVRMTPLFSLVAGLVRAALDVVAPPSCPLCRGRVQHPGVFCPPCALLVLPIRACGTDGVYAGFVYGGPLSEAIRRCKYDGDRFLASALGRAMAWAAPGPGAGVEADVVIPVPLSRERLAERGFNQAAPLARALARRLDARAAPMLLARTRATRSQASQGAAGRRAILDDNPFRVTGSVRGLRVAVCDDVVTTGATLAACVTVLQAAGAAQVVGVALARAGTP